MPSPIGEPMRRTSRDRDVRASAIGLVRVSPDASAAANAQPCRPPPRAALPAAACYQPRGRATKAAMTSRVPATWTRPRLERLAKLYGAVVLGGIVVQEVSAWCRSHLSRCGSEYRK